MSYNEHLTSGLATIWNCSTSEATERAAPKRKRFSQDSVREEIPWTAARCNRLLRTITSRVNILRKQSKLCAASASARDVPPSRNLDRNSSEETTPPRKDHRISANDPEWVPGAKPKTSSRTYGGRTKPQQKIAARKADSGFSTPFVKRLLNNAPASTVKTTNPWSCNASVDDQPKKMRQLPVQLPSSNEEAQRNLVRAFDNLLTTTSSATTSERTGARSLMSACLRRVPDYIDLEAEELNENDGDDEDITSSIYSELESLGTNSGGGWLGLREVVRSHALHYMSAAIEDGMIHDTRISELVNVCSKHGALSEADLLLQTWISRDDFNMSNIAEGSHPALTLLTELRSTHDASELYLRHHTLLIELGHFYPSDVLRPGSAPFRDLIRSLVQGSGQDVALAYLEAGLIEDCKSSNATSQPVFSRLAAFLASLALAQGTTSNTSTAGLGLFAIVNRIATTISQSRADSMGTSSNQDQNTSAAAKHRTTTHPFIMASTLLRLTSPSEMPTTAVVHLDALISAISVNQSAFVKFTINVINNFHRFGDADKLESLLLATSGLLSPPVECSSESQSILNRLAFEVAFAYRDQTGIDIDEHFTAKRAASNRDFASSIKQTPRRRVQVSGYKWEEGLCEWVAATPLPKPHPPNLLPNTQKNSPPKQLLTPKQDQPTPSPKTSPIALRSSPDIIGNFQSPTHTSDATPRAMPNRPALQERSANQNVHAHKSSSPRQKNAPSYLKPPVPKQVHLKEERAKKAALLAQSAAMAPPPPPQASQPAKQAHLKRPHTIASSRVVDDDELGSLTPARKKSKRSSRLAGVRRASARTSLPARMRTLGEDGIGDGMSEDELGL